MTTGSQFDDSREWDQFVITSPQGAVFCESRFLSAAGSRFETVAVGNGSDAELGAIIVYDGDVPVRAPAPYTVYQGVLFSEKFAGTLTHRTIPRMLRLVEQLLEMLSTRLPRISFCLHPSIRDVRAFLWFHHETPQRGKFRVDVRYTATLDLAEIGDAERHLGRVRAVRRREYREAAKQGFTIEETRDIGEFLGLYRATFERQDLVIPDEHVGLVESLARGALDGGFGRLYVTRSSDGRAASMALFLYDAHTGYYMFGANDPGFRRSGASTHLLVEAIWRLRAHTGIGKIDMVGVNSPNRGDFKISLGAALVPYYVVDWERP